jgi:hypothetical protein
LGSARASPNISQPDVYQKNCEVSTKQFGISKFLIVAGMNYYEELTKACPPATGTMFGDKSDGYPERLEEARRLTQLMQTQRPFCFLRMGDVELKFLLTYQDDRLDQLDRSEYGDGPLSGTQGCGNPGLGPRYAGQLWKVYEQADYVDFHERNWPNEHLVKK